MSHEGLEECPIAVIVPMVNKIGHLVMILSVLLADDQLCAENHCLEILMEVESRTDKDHRDPRRWMPRRLGAVYTTRHERTTRNRFSIDPVPLECILSSQPRVDIMVNRKLMLQFILIGAKEVELEAVTEKNSPQRQPRRNFPAQIHF